MTLVNMVLGNFDYDALVNGNRLLGPVLFILFFLFVGIALMVKIESFKFF